MSRILRGVRYVAEGVLIGDAPRRSALRVPPPPPPPPVPIDAEDVHEEEWATQPWEPMLADEQSVEEVRSDPREALAAERLEEAERLLGDAQAEAESLLLSARREAAELADAAQVEVARARGEAAEIREEVAAELERLRAEARESGHAEGHEHGLAEGIATVQRQMAEQLGRVTALAENAAVDRRELLHNAEAEVVRLALDIARKVLHREIETDPEIVRQIAEAALQQVATSGLVKLRVHPDDYSDLSAYWTHVHGRAEGERTYEVVADPDVGRGGVVIETRSGSVDAQIETQLDEIARTLGARSDDDVPSE